MTDPREIRDMPRDEAVALLREVLRVDEMTARFIYALERGEITGDVVEVADPEEEVE